MMHIGQMYVDLGRHDEAESYNVQALKICEQLFGDAHPFTSEMHNELGLVYLRTGLYEKAEVHFKQALEIIRLPANRRHSLHPICLSNLAWLYYEQARYAEAEPLAREALEISHPEDPNYAVRQDLMNRLMSRK